MHVNPTSECLALAPWSMSKAKMALGCPWQFHEKYVLKHKGEEPPATSRRKVGLAAHETVEALLKRPGAKIGPAMDLCCAKHSLTSAEIEELSLYKSTILEFIDRVTTFRAKHMDTRSELLVEMRLAFLPDFTPCAFFNNAGLFRGVIDLGMPTKSGNLVVIDHKARAKGRMEWYIDQMKAYQVLGVYGMNIPNYAVHAVQPAVHYILDGVIDWVAVSKRQEIVTHVRNWLVGFLNKAAFSAQKTDVKQSGIHCDWCAFAAGCEVYASNQKKKSGGNDDEKGVNL